MASRAVTVSVRPRGLQKNANLDLDVQILGVEEAKRVFAEFAIGAAEIGGWNVAAGANVPWAYGIEFGHHRKSGGLARRAGGTHALSSATSEVMRIGDRVVRDALEAGPNEARSALKRIGRLIVKIARKLSPYSGRNKRPAKGRSKAYHLRSDFHVASWRAR